MSINTFWLVQEWNYEVMKHINKIRDFYLNYVIGYDNTKEYFDEYERTVLSIANKGISINYDTAWYFQHLYECIHKQYWLSQEQIELSLIHNNSFDFSSFNLALPKDFTLQMDERGKHPEAMNQMSINFKDATKTKWIRICTMNFFFIVRSNDRIELIINNIQGCYNSKCYGESKKTTSRVFGKLNKGIGRDWQSHIISTIVNLYSEKYNIIWELPPKYSLWSNEEDAYIKYLLRYIEIYISGWIPLKNINGEYVSLWFQTPIKKIIHMLWKYNTMEQSRIVKLLRKKYTTFIDTLIAWLENENREVRNNILKSKLAEALSFKNHTISE